jgi:hypothetical protein
MAVEYGRTDARNGCPGGVNTESSRFAPRGCEHVARIVARLRHMQEPESVAAMIAYVGSDDVLRQRCDLAIDGGTTTG